MKLPKAVLLDRDGVINFESLDYNYIAVAVATDSGEHHASRAFMALRKRLD